MTAQLHPRELLDAREDLYGATNSRRAFLGNALNAPIMSTLEFGALHLPTILPGECDARFTDYSSTETLLARHANDSNVEVTEIAPVDYVADNVASLVDAAKRTFDLVIANHVIEHVPNIVAWLNAVEALTPANGRLMLCVPDRRYTFDYYRECSDIFDIVRAHEECAVRPDMYMVARHQYFMQVDANVKTIREGKVNASPRPRRSLAESLRIGRESQDRYQDSHCWVFTCNRFLAAMAALRSLDLTRWAVESHQQVSPGGLEFRVLMVKRPLSPDEDIERLCAPHLDPEPAINSASAERAPDALVNSLRESVQHRDTRIAKLEAKLAQRERRIGGKIDSAIGRLKRRLRGS